MDKEKLISIVQEIVSNAGLSELITVSTNDNELGDVMIYSSDEKKDYLAFLGKPVIPCSYIKNILYMIPKEENEGYFDYVNPLLRLEFDLGDNACIIVEFPAGPEYWFVCDGKAFKEHIEKSVSAYISDKKNTWCYQLIYSIVDKYEYNGDTETCDEDTETCIDRINEYLRSRSFVEEDDKKLLFRYTFLSLLSDFQWFSPVVPMTLIIERGLENDFLEYVSNYDTDDKSGDVFKDLCIHESAKAIRYFDQLKRKG